MIDAVGNVSAIAVFGGTSAIGLAAVENLVGSRTHRVVLAGRDSEGLNTAADRVAALGVPEVVTTAFEASDLGSHERAVQRVFEHGDIDIAILAFGDNSPGAAAEGDPDLAVGVAQVNYTAAVSIGLRVAARFRSQGHGTLVVLSSAAAERVSKSSFVTGSSKAGLDAFAVGLGDALHEEKIRVIVVRPGFVRTRQTAGLPDGPMAVDPGEVGIAIASAVRTGKPDIVYVPAALRGVMSGLRHLPRPLFRRIPL